MLESRHIKPGQDEPASHLPLLFLQLGNFADLLPDFFQPKPVDPPSPKAFTMQTVKTSFMGGGFKSLVIVGILCSAVLIRGRTCAIVIKPFPSPQKLFGYSQGSRDGPNHVLIQRCEGVGTLRSEWLWPKLWVHLFTWFLLLFCTNQQHGVLCVISRMCVWKVLSMFA